MHSAAGGVCILNAVELLAHQTQGAGAVARTVIAGIPDDLWRARADASANALAFTAWHIPATCDWLVHTWLDGVPDLREQAPLAGATIAFAHPPFGMTREAADEIGEIVTKADVLAYHDATQAALAACIAAFTEADLEVIPDGLSRAFRLPAHEVAGYREEVESLAPLPLWRLFSAPVNGHVREHVGEIVEVVRALKAAR